MVAQVGRLKGNALVAILVLVHILVFEFLFFFYESDISRASKFWKAIFPGLIFAIYAQSYVRMARRTPYISWFSIIYVLLLIWAGLGSIINLGVEAGFIAWSKESVRVLFVVGFIGAIAAAPQLLWQVSMAIVVVAILTFAQFATLFLTILNDSLTVLSLNEGAVSLAGRWGMLGNINSIMNLPSFSFPIPRLCGFWNEPSNASAYMFAAFFIARSLTAAGFSSIWKKLSWLCLLGGICCFSNAGYMGMGIAFLYPAFLSSKGRFNTLYRIVLAVIAMWLVALAILGREYVVFNMPENDLARVVTGARDITDTTRDYDAYSGRLESFDMAFEMARSSVFGIGLIDESMGKEVAASAIFRWLGMTGLVGLVLLLIRESLVYMCGLYISRRSVVGKYLTQAWLVVMMQQLSYGAWTNSIYLTLVCLMFGFAYILKNSDTRAKPRQVIKTQAQGNYDEEVLPRNVRAG